MAYDIGEMQAAIWRTEEALQAQRERAASEIDPFLAELASRSLAALEDLLVLQERMLNVLLQPGTTLAGRREFDAGEGGPRYSQPLGGAGSAPFLSSTRWNA